MKYTETHFELRDIMLKSAAIRFDIEAEDNEVQKSNVPSLATPN